MAKLEIKVVHLGIEDMKLLPPTDGLACQECAVRHHPTLPHNAQSLYYQYYFYKKHGRWPTWADAIAHCDDEMKQIWIEELGKKGIKVEVSV